MRKKTILLAVLLLGLLTSVFAGFFPEINAYVTNNTQDNVHNQGNKINQVEITNIILSNDRRNPVGIYYDFLFNVTVENKGINDISGLVLDVNLINYNRSAYEIRFMETNSKNVTFSLAPGEVRIFQGGLLIGLDSPLIAGRLTDVFIDATVKLDYVVLNETRKAFPDGPTPHSTYHAGDGYTTVYYPTEIHPPNGTKLPIVTITSPVNNTVITSNNLTMSFHLTLEASTSYPITLEAVYYKPSWQSSNVSIDIDSHTPFMKETLPFSINATDIPEGTQSITVYAHVMCEYETSRENVSQSPSEIFVMNYLYIYSNFYRIFGSSSVTFTVAETINSEPEPFPTTQVAATIAVSALIISAGLIVYFKKGDHRQRPLGKP